MPRSPVFWSARACRFRRAGVYYGLSPAGTHLRVAQRLLPRRGAPYPPGTVNIRDGHSAPLVYFAIRDPSAVRVVPVRNGAASDGENGKGHVSLVFPPDPRARPPAGTAGSAALKTMIADDHSQIGFVVTVGLRPDHEAVFHRRVVLENPGVAYSQLCDVIIALRDEFPD